MYTILRSEEFDVWLHTLRDLRGKARILGRIKSAENGNFGNSEPVGEGVSEMKIDFGPGYRVYYTRHELVVYVLLLGGDKSTQKRDIKHARRMALDLKRSKE
ncbi:type II toxin-antitoxin system RelE/ParE family toxin [Mycoavidus cysteinexigens]|nr:type II toxin-antitoxin system RelE/ParE family toxin [Mycoavidus cysteinexigens]